MEVKVSSLLAQVPDLADHESRRLLLLAAQADPVWMLGDPVVDRHTAERFRVFVQRRREGEPLQYIEGTVEFGPIELLIDSRALIPRPETERLWELAVDLVTEIELPTIVDMCTGSGNLALALKHSRPEATVIGCDMSPEALALAGENAARLNLDVSFVHGDLFAALPPDLAGEIDLIVSNPPYLATSDFDGLPIEVRDHEPRSALVAEDDGLDILRQIGSQATSWLSRGGVVICEIGETQGEACCRLFSSLAPHIEPDLTGRDRFVVGRTPMRSDVH